MHARKPASSGFRLARTKWSRSRGKADMRLLI